MAIKSLIHSDHLRFLDALPRKTCNLVNSTTGKQLPRMTEPPCSICGTIGESAVANTGRDEYFKPPITSLQYRGLDETDDICECPECGAVFHWNSYRAFTGSGNNDEDTLTRLAPGPAAIFRAVFATEDGAVSLDGLPEYLRLLAEKFLRRKGLWWA